MGHTKNIWSPLRSEDCYYSSKMFLKLIRISARLKVDTKLFNKLRNSYLVMALLRRSTSTVRDNRLGRYKNISLIYIWRFSTISMIKRRPQFEKLDIFPLVRGNDGWNQSKSTGCINKVLHSTYMTYVRIPQNSMKPKNNLFINKDGRRRQTGKGVNLRVQVYYTCTSSLRAPKYRK